MNLFGWNPEQTYNEAKKTVSHTVNEFGKKAGQVTTDIWTHGGREALIGAGIVGAAVLTGGAAAGALGVVEGGTLAGAASVGGYAAGAATLAGGVSGWQTAEAITANEKASEEQAKIQREVDKENAKADAQRRANLLSLRKQVGAVNVGSKSTVFSGGSTENKQTATGVILG